MKKILGRKYPSVLINSETKSPIMLEYRKDSEAIRKMAYFSARRLKKALKKSQINLDASSN